MFCNIIYQPGDQYVHSLVAIWYVSLPPTGTWYKNDFIKVSISTIREELVIAVVHRRRFWHAIYTYNTWLITQEKQIGYAEKQQIRVIQKNEEKKEKLRKFSTVDQVDFSAYHFLLVSGSSARHSTGQDPLLSGSSCSQPSDLESTMSRDITETIYAPTFRLDMCSTL